MKKISILVALFCLGFAATSMAQRNWSPEDMAKMKERREKTFVDSLGITSAVADSVISIEDGYRSKMMDMRKSGASRDDMRSQMQTIQAQKNADVKKILSDDAYNKYIGMEERSRARMQNRMGGGGRPNSN
ncbi:MULTISPECIES: hypothetical protein [Chitinophagaceae]